ncbi:unnamed protein product [Peronospora effusa]|nr:unnamed protein product [Peronospora effusa]
MVLKLTPQDKEDCRDLTMQLLDRALYDCDELGLGTTHVASHADMSSRRWKKLQSHTNVTLYADQTANSAWHPVMNREDWEHPVAVVAICQLKCSVDDMLLALMAPSLTTVHLRCLLLDRPSQHAELVPIVKPTETSPFQFLGVLRVVYTQNWPMTMFISPREMVLMIATGDVVTANGRRFGYEILLSVPICRGSGMTRTQVLETRVFWDHPDGTVGMYIKHTIDIKAHFPESVKIGIICHEFMRFWKFIPRSITTKKLRWCLKYKRILSCGLQSQFQVMGGSVSCGGCGTYAPKLVNGKPRKNDGYRCTLCDVWLCWKSSCRTSCQVTAALGEGSSVGEKELALCPRCILFAQNASAVNIACSELPGC